MQVEQEQQPLAEEEIAQAWAPLLNEAYRSETTRKEVECAEPSVLWTQARKQMLALEARELRRAEAEQQKAKEREVSLMAIRREAEMSSRRNQVETKNRREEEQRLEEEKRAEARRREREQRETMAPTVRFEEVWEVF